MKIYNIINGVAKTVSNTKVNIDGIWREVCYPYNNINGSWKTTPRYNVRIYHNKTIYSEQTLDAGSQFTLPTFTDLCGYATSSNSITSAYSPGQVITVNNSMDLYCLVVSESKASANSNNNKEVSITIPYTQTITITVSSGTSSGPFPAITADGNAPYICINNQYISHTSDGYTQRLVNGDTVIKIRGYSYDTPSGGGSCSITVGYSTKSAIKNTNL